jgi:hypothetical protein
MTSATGMLHTLTLVRPHRGNKWEKPKMKHLSSVSKTRHPAEAAEEANGVSELVCGYLFDVNNTKCVDRDSPVAGLLKTVPVP